jgi:hypothetical protein
MSRKPDPLPCVASFLAGAFLPLPAWLALAGLPGRGLQVSLLLMSAVCLVAASAPWWMGWLEDRRIARLMADVAPYGWDSTEL